MPTISVVVPLYMVESFACRCIKSIIVQTYADYELILVDDGSPDDCGYFCDEYALSDDRIVVLHQKNAGLSAARNVGIDLVFSNRYGEWLTFIDGDDWVRPDYLEVLYAIATANQVDCSVCVPAIAYQNHTVTNSESGKVFIMAPDSAYEPDFMVKSQGSIDSACSKLYKTTLFSGIRFPVGRIHEDTFTTYRVIFQCSLLAVTFQPLYMYVQSENSITRSPWTQKRLDQLDALEGQISFFRANEFEMAYKYVVKAYISSLNHQIECIKQNCSNHLLLDKERNRLKRALSLYRHGLGISLYANPDEYRNIYPRTSFLLCKIRAALTAVRGYTTMKVSDLSRITRIKE